MRLVFVRHAETVANAEGRLQGHADFELSDAGRAQAERLWERFDKEQFRPSHVYTSPLKRTAETTRIVARHWRLPIRPLEDLKEHDVGVMSGLTWEEAGTRYPAIDKDLELSRQLAGVPGAESLQELRLRARGLIKWTLGSHEDPDELLMVTHGGILSHFVSELLGTPRSWGLSARNTAVFDFTLKLAQWAEDGDSLVNSALWRIDRFNDVSHLE